MGSLHSIHVCNPPPVPCALRNRTRPTPPQTPHSPPVRHRCYLSPQHTDTAAAKSIAYPPPGNANPLYLEQQLDQLQALTDRLPRDHNWPVARRLVTAALVLYRLRYGTLSPGAVQRAARLLLSYYGLHRDAAKAKRVMEFLHVRAAVRC